MGGQLETTGELPGTRYHPRRQGDRSGMTHLDLLINLDGWEVRVRV